jgi:hypothetical protein
MIDQQNAAPAEVLAGSDQIVMESLAKFHKRCRFGPRILIRHSTTGGYNFPVLSNSVLTPSTSFDVKAVA